jgi:cytochrome c oxidase cbb3-type subunit 1
MERFASAAEPALSQTAGASPGVVSAVRHGLAWLVFGNSIGVMLAILLLLPGWNRWLGEWTYGRWMMVHMNVALFGWSSLPMVAFLFKAFRVDTAKLSGWCRPVVWLWSAALLAGSISWLQGHSSGKLFLDWSGYSRVFFPLALFSLWLLLAAAFLQSRDRTPARMAKAAGLLVLLAVPFVLYVSSGPQGYPAVNPATGGPTGGSQLESTLGIVLILLALPFAMAPRTERSGRALAGTWVVFALEAILCVLLGRGDASHRAPAQYLGLASVLVWVFLIPVYYRCFRLRDESRRWRTAFLWWWGGLVVTGWIVFLPGVLDRAKFTDILVGHSLAAVAGFLSAYILFVVAELLGSRDAWIVNRTWSFYAWNLGVLAYVLVMLVAGWIEGSNPAFTIVPGATRDLLYTLRLLTGIAMLAGSAEWLVASASLRHGPLPVPVEAPQAEVA